MTQFIASLAVGFLFSLSSFASVQSTELLMDVDGKIYPKDTFPERACKDFFLGVKCPVDSWGKYHLTSKKEGAFVHHHIEFSTPEGPQVIEDSWEQDGHVKRATVENRALKKKSTLEVKNDKAYYTVTDLESGKVKTDEEYAEKHLVVPSTIMVYIRPFADKIARGETVKIKIAVLDRRESFSFNIVKIRDVKDKNGDPIQVLEMTGASPFVKMATDPMYFYVRQKTGEMFAYEGESALRKMVKGDWEKLQVRSAYEYKINRFRKGGAVSTAASAHSSDCDPMAVITGKNMPKCEVKR